MKWIKLFTGTAAQVETDVNAFTAAHKGLNVEFVEARPTVLHGSADIGVLACVQYESAKQIVEVAAAAEQETE